MNLIQRAQDILLKPKETWPQIAAEPASVASIYQPWLLVIAAIPAVASFIGLSVLGIAGFRIPLSMGLSQLVLGYLFSLVTVYGVALIVDALAPHFGGRKNFVAALKLVAYGATAAYVGGIVNLLPALSFLGLVAAAYSVYLIYLGLPVLMECPPDKAPAYTAVVVVAAIVIALVLGAVTAAFMPSQLGALGGFGR